MMFSRPPIRQILNDIAWPDSTFRKAPPGMPDEDWDLMFLAVQVRLENCAKTAPNRFPEKSPVLPPLATQQIVMECVHALQALHTALKQNRNEHW